MVEQNLLSHDDLVMFIHFIPTAQYSLAAPGITRLSQPWATQLLYQSINPVRLEEGEDHNSSSSTLATEVCGHLLSVSSTILHRWWKQEKCGRQWKSTHISPDDVIPERERAAAKNCHKHCLRIIHFQMTACLCLWQAFCALNWHYAVKPQTLNTGCIKILCWVVLDECSCISVYDIKMYRVELPSPYVVLYLYEYRWWGEVWSRFTVSNF